jgi:hypothetical protein
VYSGHVAIPLKEGKNDPFATFVTIKEATRTGCHTSTADDILATLQEAGLKGG